MVDDTMPSATHSSSLTRASFSSYLLLGVLLIAANLRAPITSLGPVLGDVSHYFALSSFSAGLLNALPLLIFALGSPMAPWLTRHIGLERALGYAMLSITAGCLLRSFGDHIGLWGGTLLVGIGIAIANVLVVPLVKRDFPDHTALCIGLYAATMALMAALASGIAAPLAEHSVLGWKLSLGIWAGLAFVAMLVWLPAMQNKAAASAAGPGEIKRPSLWRSAVAWHVSLFMALHTMVFYTLIDWFPSIAAATGMSSHDSGLYLFAYQAIAVVANLVTSFAIKKLSNQSGIGVCCSLAIVIGLIGLLCWPAWSLLWLLCAGIGAGMSMVTCLTLFGLRTSDHHQAGALSGMAQCVGYAIGATGPYLTGLLHEKTGSWNEPLEYLLAAALLQVLFAWLAGRDRLVS